MHSTANMWVLLCEELEARRAMQSGEQQSAAARTFEEAAKQVFRGNSPRLRDALEIAGDIHQGAGAGESALRCYQEALDIAAAVEAFVPQARIATKMALLSESREELRAACKFYMTAIEASESARDRSQIATLLNNLASLHKRCGDFAACERTYRRALQEAQQIHGPNHPEVALIANNLGVAYSEHGDLDQAENAHMQALGIRETNFGGNHPDVAQSLANLAVIFHTRRDHAKAEQYYNGALEILHNFRGPDDPELRRIEANYERLPQVRLRNLKTTRRL